MSEANFYDIIQQIEGVKGCQERVINKLKNIEKIDPML